MPNRILKESIRYSEKLNGLTDWQYRVWVSLVTYVDDYGRGDARVPVIRGAVFPLRESVTNRDVEEALQALTAAGCIRLYEAEGCPYLCFPEWEKHQNVRNKRSRYPAPPEEEEGVCLSPQASACNCAQVSANAPVIQSESLSESLSESENESESGEGRPEARPADGPASPAASRAEPSKPARFSPPTQKDVEAYCKEAGLAVDAARFMAYYESNGWRVGRNPMHCWQAAARSWARNGFGETAKPDRQGDYIRRSYTEQDYRAMEVDLDAL